MAQTINRNGEITTEDFRSLKKIFNERTYTKALYRCVEFVVNEVPNYEKRIKKLERRKKELEKENKILKTKQANLMEILVKKQSIALDI